ncbi:phosphoribosyltransferase [Rhodoferax sp. 4810]|nr:phosphoribosyltransferase [Rhodoferax jenense]
MNISRGRIQKTLDLLALESPAPVVKLDHKWQLTATHINPTFWARAERLTALRRIEQQQMQQYVDLITGHMAFLIRALDGEPSIAQLPALPPLPTSASPALVRAAVAFLRRSSLTLEPRKKWANGRTIAANERLEPGRALCRWRDAGWGELVFYGKYRDQQFADELVNACVTTVRNWQPTPAPTWVTCIPSLRRPALVPDFARRVAQALGLPFHAVLRKTTDRPEQKTMANSAQQAANVADSLAICAPVPPGAVLLLDDMVDSRWTLTVAASVLRRHGSGVVYPFVLALTGHTA